MKAWIAARRSVAAEGRGRARRLLSASVMDGLPVGKALASELQSLEALARRADGEAEAVERLLARRARAKRRARARRSGEL